MNVRFMRRLGIAAWVAQALLQVVWHAWWLPPQRMPVAVALLIALLPLALPLLYWRVPARALIAAGMVSLLYFCHGVAEAWASPPERVPASIEIALALALIGSLIRSPHSRAAARVSPP